MFHFDSGDCQMVAQIESATVLIRQLGSDLAIIKKLDPLRRSRDETKNFRLRLLREYDTKCGCCTQSFKRDELEIAHIIPLEIGGLTIDSNLIVLCKTCHRSYDSGHWSINCMTQVAENWRKGILTEPRPKLGLIKDIPPVRFFPPESVRGLLADVSQMQVMRKFVKAINLIATYIAENPTNADDRIYLLIKQAEMHRRRSAQGTAHQALRTLNEINPSDVPSESRSHFYYELGYVHRLLGKHQDASALMRLSADSSRHEQEGLPGVDYVAALGNEILCRMAMEQKPDEKMSKDFEKDFDNLKKIALRSGTYWGWRWALNCAMHALQVRIKANDSRGSWKRLQQVRNDYFNSDLSKGWDIAARPTMTSIEGLVRILFSKEDADLDLGIRLLARAFITRLGRRQRPEGIRDIGFALAIGLRKQAAASMQSTAQRLEKLMIATVDGTSVLWPSQAM